MDDEEGSHRYRDFKHYQIHIIINGHANPPLLRRDRKSFNRGGALNVPAPLGKCEEKKDVSKVVILGDSHSRGLSAKLNEKLRNSFEVIGYTKPNCNLQSLPSIDNQGSASLTNNDVLVLIAGLKEVSNDNNAKALCHVTQFAKLKSQTNIILFTPHLRYDKVTNVQMES
jgi:hypothetical protein